MRVHTTANHRKFVQFTNIEVSLMSHPSKRYKSPISTGGTTSFPGPCRLRGTKSMTTRGCSLAAMAETRFLLLNLVFRLISNILAFISANIDPHYHIDLSFEASPEPQRNGLSTPLGQARQKLVNFGHMAFRSAHRDRRVESVSEPYSCVRDGQRRFENATCGRRLF